MKCSGTIISTDYTKLFIPSSVQFLWNTAIYHHGQPVSYFPRHSAYSHRQGGHVIVVVCLLATLHKNVRTDLHEIFREGWQSAMNKWLDFRGDPNHNTGTEHTSAKARLTSASSYACFLQCFDTLLVGWQEGHLVCKNTLSQRYFSKTSEGKTTGKRANPGLPERRPLIRR